MFGGGEGGYIGDKGVVVNEADEGIPEGDCNENVNVRESGAGG